MLLKEYYSFTTPRTQSKRYLMKVKVVLHSFFFFKNFDQKKSSKKTVQTPLERRIKKRIRWRFIRSG